MNCLICKDGTTKEGTGTYLKTICCAASHVAQFNYYGSTDKFSTVILTHLFCPHFVGKSST